jgi:type II secretion system protein N
MLKKILLYGVAYPAFFLFSLIVGAYWTFPYDHLRDYIVEKAEHGGSMQLEIERLEPSWVTGVELEGVRLVTLPDSPTEEPAVLVIPRAEARISLLSLLAGTTDVSFDAELDGGGRIEGSYAESSESTHIVANIQEVDLRRIGPLREAVGLPIAGRLSGDIDLTIAQEATNTQGTADITLRNVAIGDGRTPLVVEGLGSGLTLERMNLGTVQLRLETTRGVGTIQRLRADGEHAELWGSGNVRLVQPLRMSSLDLLFRIQFKDAYRNASDRMRALFSLLEMNPQLRPARTPNGALQWRIQGAFGSRIRMTPSGRSPMPGVDDAAGEPAGEE